MNLLRFLLPLFATPLLLFAQPEVQAWGNLRGLRVDGQLLQVASSLRVVYDSWDQEWATGRERQWSRYAREGETQVVDVRMDSLFFTQTVRQTGPGRARITLAYEAREERDFIGAFYHLHLPAADFAGASISIMEPADWDLARHAAPPAQAHERLRVRAEGLRVTSARRTLEIRADEPDWILVRQDPETGDLGLYFALKTSRTFTGERRQRTFDLQLQGRDDLGPVQLELFPDFPGNAFLGLGGNFRLQNEVKDPPVIDYCLENLDVRMGRVELPWQHWHPVDTINPLIAARQGHIHPKVEAAMQMAQRLYEMHMPVLLAAWFPPDWAAEGEVWRNPRNPDGTYGNPLREERLEDIYASLTWYILYLREAYGVEVSLFSFNESDLGINVRQTAEEHATFIKGLGEYLAAHGLDTKLLLGDTADANGHSFVNAALDDPATWAYIGAVSFHSWRGWERPTLLEWYEAADRLNVPLLIAEGSIDAAAYRYPRIFEEPHYALEEIKLYVRILAICQPQAILQWQLTSDYSPLIGGGLYGRDSLPLQPTQRFWNLKQLSATPANLRILPITSSAEEVYVTALADERQRTFALHLVNDGPAREVMLTGLPERIRRLRSYRTDAEHGMEAGEEITVVGGEARFRVGAACFVSLFVD